MATVVLLLFVSVPGQKNNSGGSSSVGNGGSITGKAVYKELTVRELSDHPENYLNQNVKVLGKLVSQGSGKDLKFYLVNGLDRIAIRPWLPLEITPPDDHLGNGGGGRGGLPMTMLDVVGRFLFLDGQVKNDPGGLYFSVRAIEPSPLD